MHSTQLLYCCRQFKKLIKKLSWARSPIAGVGHFFRVKLVYGSLYFVRENSEALLNFKFFIEGCKDTRAGKLSAKLRTVQYFSTQLEESKISQRAPCGIKVPSFLTLRSVFFYFSHAELKIYYTQLRGRYSCSRVYYIPRSAPNLILERKTHLPPALSIVRDITQWSGRWVSCSSV